MKSEAHLTLVFLFFWVFQESMRADFAKQAALLEQLSSEKEAAAAQAHAAWEELHQVKQQLMVTEEHTSSSTMQQPQTSGASGRAATRSKPQQQQQQQQGGGRGQKVQPKAANMLQQGKGKQGVAATNRSRSKDKVQPPEQQQQLRQRGQVQPEAQAEASSSSSVPWLQASSYLQPVPSVRSTGRLTRGVSWGPELSAATVAGGDGAEVQSSFRGDGGPDGGDGDALDGFMVETHLVPLSVNGIPPVLSGATAADNEDVGQGQQQWSQLGLPTKGADSSSRHFGHAGHQQQQQEEEGGGRALGHDAAGSSYCDYGLQVAVVAPFYGREPARQNGR